MADGISPFYGRWNFQERRLEYAIAPAHSQAVDDVCLVLYMTAHTSNLQVSFVF